VGAINVYDKIMIENQKKIENMEKKFFYINLYLKIVYKWSSQLAKAS